MSIVYIGVSVGIALVSLYAAWTVIEYVNAREYMRRQLQEVERQLQAERNWLQLQVSRLEFGLAVEQALGLCQPTPFDKQLDEAAASFAAEVEQWSWTQ